ncbi:MAG: threonylcarbamoyl-AMP synthase [Gammaproteobacteria bacterium CG11_big_fil_rev_8_21_14_0_20_46_22]|nr:MAG: threonylcarbamoyl-AMP synthase [Gammaproteobacteria bacterium CG12_big_fil_rev_8_21_14_0_65_46_12]PIR10783.1 MAG: threonylcarbamoyl-AMP synthase [Gammaproteobacteria bacterium CG11_big_fil_rev_8_21_14_0_20_46_22]
MIHTLNDESLKQAVDRLRAGELIGLPTETVYGLAADASNTAAVEKIFTLKQRPKNQALIVHVSHNTPLSHFARDIPEFAKTLIEQCWPGPLSLILHKRPEVNDWVTGGHDTIALRCPKHPVAQAVLNTFGGGLAAPSANRHCHLSPTTAEDVFDEFGDELALILDGGACDVGIESTILDLTHTTPTIVRPGFYTAQDLESIINTRVVYASSDQANAPGNLAKHYAPETPTFLCETENLPHSPHIGVLSFKPASHEHWICIDKNPEAMAHALYHSLRELDHAKLESIVIETPPQDEAWRAIWDRLKRLCSQL